LIIENSTMKYFIKTFGCQQNWADSERIAAAFKARGMKPARSYKTADYIVINTCMVRKSAENSAYGLVNNLSKFKDQNPKIKMKIILTGCMVGLAYQDKTGKYLARLKKILPAVDEFMPISEVGFDFAPLRQNNISAWVPITNGCNNFCTYCVVPYTRGREISRAYEEIVKECQDLKKQGYKNITLLGQNVNSYGSDLILNSKVKSPPFAKTTENEQNSKVQIKNQKLIDNKKIQPVYVKHLGKFRIPTLFPYLLDEVAKMGFEKIDFISSNPWDFSNELIEVIAKNANISRTLHLPVQSGDNDVLKRMNRWYTYDEYLDLVANLKLKIKNLKLTTDIIVGFCGETDEEFNNTVKLCKAVGFNWAYVAMYSPRPFSVATKTMKDNIPYTVKKNRWQVLENLINQPQLKKTKKKKDK